MGVIYRVSNWDRFENNKSREREACSYVCVPNKQHGMGLNRILAEKDGASIYGIWQLILGAVSRQGKHREGWLTDDGHRTGAAWAPADLHVLWRIKLAEIERALEVLSSARIGWIEVHESSQVVDNQGPAVGARQVPAECPPGAPEEKRIEENGIEKKSTPSAPIFSAGIVIPECLNAPEFFAEWEKYQAYRRERKLSKLKDSSIQTKLDEMAAWGRAAAIESIRLTISNCWQGLFEPRQGQMSFGKTPIQTCPLPAHEVPAVGDLAARVAAIKARKDLEGQQ